MVEKGPTVTKNGELVFEVEAGSVVGIDVEEQDEEV